MAYKNSSRSGAGANDVKLAKNAMENYAFLTWIDLFIRPRKSTSNIQEQEILAQSSFESSQLQHNDNSSDDSDCSDIEYNAVGSGISADDSLLEKMPREEEVSLDKRQKTHASRKKLEPPTSVEIDAMKAMTTYTNKKLENAEENTETDDDFFGHLSLVPSG